jgi:hypothetical protein
VADRLQLRRRRRAAAARRHDRPRHQLARQLRGNRNNPDPANWVGFGNRTTDDMARHWLTFYYMSDEDFQAEVNERTSLKRGTANQ